MTSHSEFQVHFVHEGRPHEVILRSGDVASPGPAVVTVAGVAYEFLAGSNPPAIAREIFESFSKEMVASDRELATRVAAYKGLRGVSIISKTTDVVTEPIFNRKVIKTDEAVVLEKAAYEKLNACPATDGEQIAKIVQEANCSVSTLFEIAERVEKEGKVELANAIRTAARPFDVTRIVEGTAKQILENYVLIDKGERGAAYIQERLRSGAYQKLFDKEEFAAALTHDLRLSTGDKHFDVFLGSVEDPKALSAEELEKENVSIAEDLRKRNFGFAEVSMDGAGTVYVDLETFLNPGALLRGEKVILQNTRRIMDGLAKLKPKAVVFGLQNNGGGNPEMVRLLCSYFLEPGVRLNTLEWRHKPTQIFNSLSYEDLPKEVRMATVPLIVLTGKKTFSAAEEFANNLKVLRRATIVGETTAGGANPGDSFNLGDGLAAFIPTGRAVNPHTRSNWEGIGVVPDYAIAPGEDALKRAKLILAEQQKAVAAL